MTTPLKAFPIMLNLTGRRVVIVGGGTVGLRRAKALLAAGAAVVLIDPALEGLDAALAAGGVQLCRQPYQKELLAGALAVFACTNDPKLNARIASDAREHGAIVNVADQPEDCDFYMPSVIQDGDVVVAVGTGGASPALAAMLAHRLADAMPARIGEFAALLADLRRQARDLVSDSHARMELMKRMASEEVYSAFLSGGAPAVKAKFKEFSGGLIIL